jgi:hypothetical protein
MLLPYQEIGIICARSATINDFIHTIHLHHQLLLLLSPLPPLPLLLLSLSLPHMQAVTPLSPFFIVPLSLHCIRMVNPMQT